MCSDVAALVIALLAIQISKRKADSKRTFGYYRFEILAAVLNAVILMVVAIYIFYEAYQRLFTPHIVESTTMLFVAGIGLIVNTIAITLLHIGSKHSLNVRAAYLEAWADMLGSIGVIVAGLLIRYTGWAPIDSIIAVGIGLWVLPRLWILLKESINILLEGVPEGIELAEITGSLAKIPGVTEVHDLHVWALSSGKISLTVHLVIDKTQQSEQTILKAASEIIEGKFRVTHSTIQIEVEPCHNGDLEKMQTVHY